jgi:methanethiol S-methyltransferase
MTPGFWPVMLATGLYGLLHSLLAASSTKAWVQRRLGNNAYSRYYHLFFSILGAVTLFPVLALVALLPDQAIYSIPTPWVYITLALQAAALIGIYLGVAHTGAMRFVGIEQALERGIERQDRPNPEKLVVHGLYRYVRHPLYTFSFMLIWLMPFMTWNILALNLGLSAYMLVGSIFEERKLVEQFGPAYEAYRRRTPRIVPGLNRREK